MASILEEGRISAAKFALKGQIGGKSIQNLASEMLRISAYGLERRNKLDNRGLDERQFLDPLLNILKNNETGADNLIKKFDSSWNDNIDKIFVENAF